MNDTLERDQIVRTNLIEFASLLFNKMSDKYGGATTLNELTMLNYGFVCSAKGTDITVTQTSNDLNIPKSTVSRILTGMRAKGFVTEESHPTDRRRRIFSLTDKYLDRGDTDILALLDWCAAPEHTLV
jgi:DNA-binding MarR family transcriptional regulator